MAVMLIVLALALVLWRVCFWSGSFCPNSGWSKRQLQRIEDGKSPWTLLCAITYRSERQIEIRESVERSEAELAYLMAGGKR
jgi:hypothetical protein